jgi:leucyl-tRNA synthetase
MLGNKECAALAPWPVVDKTALQADTLQLAVQVNGKLRDNITVNVDANTMWTGC